MGYNGGKLQLDFLVISSNKWIQLEYILEAPTFLRFTYSCRNLAKFLLLIMFG
jgi:hypothetical protein